MDADSGGGSKDRRGGYVCTVWCKQPFSGDVKVEFDAHVIRSDIEANNINFFLHYGDPSRRPLYDTRESRASAAYKLYHTLNGYIFTFLNDRESEEGQRARFRIRRCPGFKLLDEAYGYHCRRGVTYHVEIRKRGPRLTIAVDGKERVSAEAPEPLDGGLLGLRTFRTYLWWDNVRVTRP